MTEIRAPTSGGQYHWVSVLLLPISPYLEPRRVRSTNPPLPCQLRGHAFTVLQVSEFAPPRYQKIASYAAGQRSVTVFYRT